MTDKYLIAHTLDLGGIANAVAGIYPDPIEAICVTDSRLGDLLREAVPHLNDFEIEALKQRTVRLFGVRLIVSEDP